MAEQCDLFLLILGPTYGFPPDEREAGSEKSATELEFDWARARRANKILVFIRQDALETTDARQRAFIEHVSGFMTGYNRATFSSSGQLESLVHETLSARQRQEILEIPHYLEAVRDKYARLTNPITGAEIDARTTVLLRLRTELEDRSARRSWEEASGETPRAFGFRGVLALGRKRAPRAEAPVIAGAEIDNVEYFLDTYQRFVLQGDPGAGKSTSLRRVAFNVAQQGLLAGAGTAGQRIPLYVTAVDLGRVLVQRQEFGLIQAITQILREQGLEGVDVAVESAISNNQAIVLITILAAIAPSSLPIRRRIRKGRFVAGAPVRYSNSTMNCKSCSLAASCSNSGSRGVCGLRSSRWPSRTNSRPAMICACGLGIRCFSR